MKPSVGSIHQLNVSQGGVPKLAIEDGEVTRRGLIGDRCAKTSIHGGPTQALSLLGLEVVEKLASEGHPIAPGTTGENVTICGLDWSQLEPGTRLRLGKDVLILITSYASPCSTITGSFSDGDVSRLNHRIAPGQSRLYAEVLREGAIHAGDTVIVEARDSTPDPGDAIVSEDRPVAHLRLAYVNLYVTNLKRSVEFFEKTLGLGLKFADSSFGYASLDAGPVRMGLAQIDPDDRQSAGLIGRQTGFGFVVDDLVAAHRELKGRGVAFQ